MIPGHRCNAFCGDDEHCELVYAEARAELQHIAAAYAYAYGVRVLRMRPATEAPGFDTLAEGWISATITPLTAKGSLSPSDERRFLVWWTDPSGSARLPQDAKRDQID